MSSTSNTDLDDTEESLLARAPKAVDYLRDTIKRPGNRPMGNHSSAFLRRLELIDDEVRTPDNRKITASEAKREYGEQWFDECEFTGRERVTERGKSELAKLRRKG